MFGAALQFTGCEAEAQEVPNKKQRDGSIKDWAPISRHLSCFRLRCFFILASLMPSRRQVTALSENAVLLNYLLTYSKKNLSSFLAYHLASKTEASREQDNRRYIHFS